MEFLRATNQTCHLAEDTVVVIDVLRAFTTAAYAFAAGAGQIFLVATLEEARQLRTRIPGASLMGEEDGLPVPGFEFSNSPADFIGQALAGRPLIQRTSAGTQGVVRSQHARQILSASFVCAQATASYLRQLAPEQITFVITGQGEGGYGDEDAACADYIEALLNVRSPDLTPYLARVKNSIWGRIFTDPNRPEFPSIDLELTLRANCFNFAMSVERQNRLLVMRPTFMD